MTEYCRLLTGALFEFAEFITVALLYDSITVALLYTRITVALYELVKFSISFVLIYDVQFLLTAKCVEPESLRNGGFLAFMNQHM